MAIAMDSGLIITLGDSSVDNRVRSDNTTMLDFARDLYGWQEYYEMPCLEDYPLEAKIAWAWRGHSTLYQDIYKGHNFRSEEQYEQDGSKQGVPKVSKKMNIGDYNYIFVTPETLKEMHEYISQKQSWLNKGVESLAVNAENFFLRRHWHYPKELERGKNCYVLDINDKWRDFSRGERPEGVCEDQSAFMNGIFTSVGIPSLTQNAYWHIKDDGGMGHGAYLFFDGEKWKGTKRQWRIFEDWGIEKGGADRFNLNIYIPPWNQKGHLTNWRCASQCSACSSVL